ncbi:universal stress protein [Actinospica sp. MGRD01-02]|uniref:Universal stress protein n=1 Tax=Actinospica acidithermotolerans TaxID=2828514 RepID=A0A941EG78_9ACTN|nr:universal stress protein [Actinospica acidithermotolerans]MBR7829927.1 universal stress protein [Actinospica acidithermotolerans]
MSTSTEKIGRILVGVDASENAVRALDWAASLAASLEARLTVAHALDLPDPIQAPRSTETTGHRARRHREGERILARTTKRARERHPGLQVVAELSEREPAQALAALALDADLLVTGTRGHGGFTGMLLGSVSNKLAAHAPCPIVVIGIDVPFETRPELVLGIGIGKDEDPTPIEYAFRLATLLGLSIRAVHAFQPEIAYGGYYAETEPAIAEDVETLLKPVRENHPDTEVTIDPRQGVPVPTLAQAARGARLIVVGSHRRRGPLSFGPGHIVHGLLSHADTPVAVVPIG